MQPIERNERFSNPLIHSTSPYLRQHANNPVFWYPWGEEALALARKENKPILLSIGYSTCYWCHVMEREVFENLSIAALMNRTFVNIKVDREEHPELDEIYMVARQLLTHQGGWPNNVFLTPDLKPFYAGGTYGPDEAYGKPAFPRLLEWLNYSWVTQQTEVKKVADSVTGSMTPLLVFAPQPEVNDTSVEAQADGLFALLKSHFDGRSGGFFQAPKFPHECFLQFLVGYYERTGSIEALDMLTLTLGKMCSGGLYDQVGCGFHRYAVDKEWYVPHFEKMLYTQAQMVRLYTDVARITGNPFFADIAKGVLDFVGGPMTSGTGAFYTAIDAETDGVEGAYYAWSADEFKALLTPQEVTFLTMFYALSDIPAFPGHKHVDGQVLIARKPLDLAAQQHNMPYVQLAAMAGELMNKLLVVRNTRKTPRLDDKVIVSWNGLMIDAFAHAALVFGRASYTARAREAADFILESAIDNEGKLRRIYAGGRAQFDATLEDYAFLVKGLISLWKVSPDEVLLNTIVALTARAEELFADPAAPGYFFTQPSAQALFRIKGTEDSAVPNANAVMVQNLYELSRITNDAGYLTKAQAMCGYFLGGSAQINPEHASLLAAALGMEPLAEGITPVSSPGIFGGSYSGEAQASPEDVVVVSASLFPANAAPGDNCELIVTLDIKDGWHINANRVNQSFLIPTQVDAQGDGVELLGTAYPEPLRKQGAGSEDTLLVYEGLVTVTLRLHLARADERPAIKSRLRFQPCHGTTCHAIRDIALTL